MNSNSDKRGSRLTAVQYGKMYSYFDANKETVRHLSSAILSDMLNKELGFRISKQVINMMRREMGISPGVGGTNRATYKTSRRKHIAFLAKCLGDVYGALGMTAPDQLACIANGSSKEPDHQA